MRQVIQYAIIAVLLCTSLWSQNLQNGYYVTADGQHYRNIEVLADDSIKAGISIGYDVYEKWGGNTYKGVKTVTNGVISKASSDFYLEILSNKSIYLYQLGKPKTKLTLKSTNQILEELDECDLYQKYIEKMESDPANMQAWTFCANAALQLCNAPDDAARQTILQSTVVTLKMLLPGKPCPCSDIIPASAWKKY